MFHEPKAKVVAKARRIKKPDPDKWVFISITLIVSISFFLLWLHKIHDINVLGW